MDRRNFLRNVLAAMAAGTLSTMSLAKPADPIGDLIQSLEADPIAGTIQRYQDLVLYNRTMPSISVQLRYDNPEFRELNSRADSLIGYLLENFSSGDCTRADVQSYLASKIPDTLTVAQLESVVRGLIPVVVLKQMISVDRIWIWPKLMPNFDKFAQIYKDRILG